MMMMMMLDESSCDDEHRRRRRRRHRKSRFFFEALGLLARANGKEEEANAFFTAARDKYSGKADQLRQDLHIVDVYRGAGNTKTAILLLQKIRKNNSQIPEEKAVTALLNILDPPSPPPVKLRQKR